MAKSNKHKKLTQSEKNELAQKGKVLNPAEVEAKAFSHYGRDYRKKLRELLGGSEPLYVYAFSGTAPYKLFEIDQHLNSLK
jgi:hypothetical protein